MSYDRAKLDLDVARLRDVLSYEPHTGILRWRQRRGCAPAGQTAGFIGNNGYVKIGFDRQYWFAHRLAWAHANGTLPPPLMVIDHINGIRHDNRLSNLQVLTLVENFRRGKLKKGGMTMTMGSGEDVTDNS